jgi:N-dimethylarginine dimethylaminohydrolase
MQLRTRVPGGGTPRPERWGIDSEYGRLRDLLVGPIEHYSWQPESNAVARRSLRVGLKYDRKTALAQYEEMIDAYQRAGVTVHRLPAQEGLSYQLFARDSSVMTPWGAVIMQLTKPYRRGEYAACLRFYLASEIPIYDLVTRGNIEGGDFMVLQPGVALCGYSGDRSIEPAVGEIRAWFEAEGWEFQTYAYDPYFLHLDVQMSMLADGLAAVCIEAVEPELVSWLKAKHIRVLEVSYQEAMTMGCNLVSLGAERVLIPASNRSLIERCRSEGLTVYDPEVSMIANGGGSIHCMCQALRRDSVQR